MKEEFTPQPKLSKDEVYAEYVKTGLDIKFADRFQEKYLEEYNNWSNCDNASDYAMECVKNGFKWYVRYYQNGHHELWCEEAYDYGCDCIERDFDLEDEIACMKWICVGLNYKLPDFFDDTKKTEFAKHFSFVEKEFSRDKTFMRFYVEYADEYGFDEEMLRTVSDETASYNDAIHRGKSEDFAYFYATWGGDDAWRVAELREKHQSEREHTNIPTWWEVVAASRMGWEYARKRNLDIAKFTGLFKDIYLNLSHSDEIPYYPFSEMKKKALEEALKHYGEGI